MNSELKKLVKEQVKRVLKEWFPGKEPFIGLEELEKAQTRIYNDAADVGLFHTDALSKKINAYLNELREIYGGKAEKSAAGHTDPHHGGSASYTIFVPVEYTEGDTSRYDGYVVKVSLHADPHLKKAYRAPTSKFYEIEINRVTRMSPEEATAKYGFKNEP